MTQSMVKVLQAKGDVLTTAKEFFDSPEGLPFMEVAVQGEDGLLHVVDREEVAETPPHQFRVGLHSSGDGGQGVQTIIVVGSKTAEEAIQRGRVFFRSRCEGEWRRGRHLSVQEMPDGQVQTVPLEEA